MRRNLADMNVYYKKENIKITDIESVAYIEIMDGFNSNNFIEYSVNIKIAFLDPNTSILRIVEDDAKEFVWYDFIDTDNFVDTLETE